MHAEFPSYSTSFSLPRIFPFYPRNLFFFLLLPNTIVQLRPSQRLHNIIQLILIHNNMARTRGAEITHIEHLGSDPTFHDIRQTTRDTRNDARAFEWEVFQIERDGNLLGALVSEENVFAGVGKESEETLFQRQRSGLGIRESDGEEPRRREAGQTSRETELEFAIGEIGDRRGGRTIFDPGAGDEFDVAVDVGKDLVAFEQVESFMLEFGDAGGWRGADGGLEVVGRRGTGTWIGVHEW